jgi:TIR domain
MAYKVFITSAPKDIDLVRDLAQRLEDVGIEVHSDYEGGKPSKTSSNKTTKKALANALSSADEIFVILTNESMDNPSLMFFLGSVSSWLTRVTPVVVGLETSKIPSLIKSLKYIRYPDLGRYIANLGKRTKAA